jgi:hypothetical protein
VQAAAPLIIAQQQRLRRPTSQVADLDAFVSGVVVHDQCVTPNRFGGGVNVFATIRRGSIRHFGLTP